jgi:hypothetical protein
MHREPFSYFSTNRRARGAERTNIKRILGGFVSPLESGGDTFNDAASAARGDRKILLRPASHFLFSEREKENFK